MHYSQNQLISSEYWAGHDVTDPTPFEGTIAQPISYDKTRLKAAQKHLHAGLSQLATSNCTDIRFGEGNVFDSELPDGSLVVIDQEYAQHTTFTVEERLVGGAYRLESSGDTAETFERPYSHYWLDSHSHNRTIGVQQMTFVEQSATYTRVLHWGVLMTRKNQTRYMQPFSFNVGRSAVPYIPTGSEISLPYSVGKVSVHPRLVEDKPNRAIDSVSRVRTIDVVCPAPNERPPKTLRQRRVFLAELLNSRFKLGEV